MHVTAEHIGIQILGQLKRPVLPLSVVVIEIDALLDDSKTDAMFVIVGLQVLVRHTGLVRIDFLKVSRTSQKHENHANQYYNPLHIKSPPPLKIHTSKKIPNYAW